MPCRQRDGLTRLIENTYVNYLLDRDMRARDLDVLARLAARVPLRRLVPQADSAYLHSFRDAILDDFRAVTGATAGRSLSTTREMV